MISRIALALALATAVLATSAETGEPAPPFARSLRVLEPSTYRDPVVEVVEADPPGFRLVLEREMPTPGWRLDLDLVRVDEDDGRIVIELTEVPPEGIVAQVITPAELRIPLGRMKSGHYVLELRARRDASGEHRPIQALVLVAR